jgi:hypothetical protein
MCSACVIRSNDLFYDQDSREMKTKREHIWLIGPLIHSH